VPTPTELELWFQGIHVGCLQSVFQSDDTWYGRLNLAIDRSNGATESRLIDFVEFCEQWNERARNGDADPDEFDAKMQNLPAGGWFTRNPSGEENPIEDVPVFFVGGDVTWR
jgi:hypothetical protein